MCYKKKKNHVLKIFKTIDSLKLNDLKIRNNLVMKREQIKICVIDDRGFNSDQLRKLGYKDIVVREDFDDIKDFEQYNVVLCDVDGVGNMIDSKRQGLSVAEEISNAYFPNTIVAIYTGENLIDYAYKEMENISIIRKNRSMHELALEIDKLCSVFWNPIKMWKVLEKHFRDNKLSNIEMAVLEDSYVEAFEKNDYNLFEERNTNMKKFTTEQMLKALEVGAIIVKTIMTIVSG